MTLERTPEGVRVPTPRKDLMTNEGWRHEIRLIGWIPTLDGQDLEPELYSSETDAIQAAAGAARLANRNAQPGARYINGAVPVAAIIHLMDREDLR